MEGGVLFVTYNRTPLPPGWGLTGERRFPRQDEHFVYLRANGDILAATRDNSVIVYQAPKGYYEWLNPPTHYGIMRFLDHLTSHDAYQMEDGDL